MGSNSNITLGSSTFEGGYGLYVIGDNNTITASNNTFDTLFTGIESLGNENVFILSGNTINVDFEGGVGISISGDDNALLATNNEISAGYSGIHLYGDNNVQLSDNLFTGSFESYLLFFSNGTTDVLEGSDGNMDQTTHKAGYCFVNVATFTGEIDFSGTTITAADCNEVP